MYNTANVLKDDIKSLRLSLSRWLDGLDTCHVLAKRLLLREAYWNDEFRPLKHPCWTTLLNFIARTSILTHDLVCSLRERILLGAG